MVSRFIAAKVSTALSNLRAIRTDTRAANAAARAEDTGRLQPPGRCAENSELNPVGLRDALAVPLQCGGTVFGVPSVAHRPTYLPTYGQDALRLFQSLADHAAVALQNVALVEMLRTEVTEREHQALHDSGTGLANRRRFLDRVAEGTDGGGRNA